MLSNPEVHIKQTEVLSDNWYTLRKITFDIRQPNGEWSTQSREAYDRGNGAVILLYSREKQAVVLTRQFRMPTYLNGNASGMLIEACAGLLDQDNAEDCIRRETEEETGYRVRNVTKVLEAYMSPGSVTEILYFFVAEYAEELRVHAGGGVEHEQESIEVLELPFTEALQMVQTGAIKDAKTMLLLQYAQLNNLLG
ncbi:GDP-mannose pyrophosphatase NudK [Hymenobacter lutimineralis]|uniref:GDP-mannose pyrophosphatase n=1 Tax=Hymenobacter lutimineralis TaxID=2606448 RepID=A0A5D6URY7_9BACT|nr:GDP-mannose pyrophosphatase NudK [Hymenobacter lutimineralis]TYZ05748.1 GDP-mannose pyrophosphatase NudK [Hymenobacter lutimineralis]